ncbi:hypothetical protein [Streptomyces sp. NPDC054863]
MPPALGAYKKTYRAGSVKVTGLTAQEREQVTGYGIANPRSAAASYTDSDDMKTVKVVHLLGYYGDIEDPQKTLDAVYAEQDKHPQGAEQNGWKAPRTARPGT